MIEAFHSQVTTTYKSQPLTSHNHLQLDNSFKGIESSEHGTFFTLAHFGRHCTLLPYDRYLFLDRKTSLDLRRDANGSGFDIVTRRNRFLS